MRFKQGPRLQLTLASEFRGRCEFGPGFDPKKIAD
jgi:hypothetical protein